jgi:DNA helicase-2/ATP-dependent DNA helicase PcrA
VVGDDDQSIYRWRGARVENLQQFRKDFPGVQLYRLEQNYRSTGTILAAANAIIANNSGASARSSGPAANAAPRSGSIRRTTSATKPSSWSDASGTGPAKGGQRRDNAILYRSNAQSRVFEEYLLASRIPYRVYGGLRFFERAEIKDALAYLRLISNRDDDASFERVVNLPARGIGARTLEGAARVRTRQLDFVVARLLRGRGRARCQGVVEPAGVPDADRAARRGNERARAARAGRPRDPDERAGRALSEGQGEQGRGAARNLEELVSAARGFEAGGRFDDAARGVPVRTPCSSPARARPRSGKTAVQMMTLHSARAWSFPVVFLCGLEDGLFRTSAR